MKPFVFPRRTPESQGVRSSALLALIERAEAEIDEMHSLMLLRHGQVVAEGWWQPYAPNRPHQLYSLTKSFTSTAVGLAVTEGLVGLDDAVVSFFPADLPKKVSPNLETMRVRHLLTMNSGHEQDTVMRMIAACKSNWAKGFLSLPVEQQPGSLFVYNSGASFMLSAILQKVCGMPMRKYLQPRLFEPLGIPLPKWETAPGGINTGGWGLWLRTEDIARFGQLYLQKGVWEGQQILPRAWVEQATARQVPSENKPDNDWSQGYGYQFWRCRHGAYRGDGAFGQICLVLPDQDAVLAITAGVSDMQVLLNLIWDTLLPAFADAPLPENAPAQERLSARQSRLALSPPALAVTSSAQAAVNGKTYQMEPNAAKTAWLRLDFTGDACTIVTNQGQVTCGLGEWKEGKSALWIGRPQPVAASAGWQDDYTLVATLRFYETPTRFTVTFKFEGECLTLQSVAHAQFGPPEGPLLHGRAQ